MCYLCIDKNINTHRQVKKIYAYILSMMLCLAAGTASAYSGAAINGASELVEPTVKVVINGLVVDNPTDNAIEVAVFSITGTMVRHTDVAPGDCLDIELSPGLYIVKAGDHSQKIIIR